MATKKQLPISNFIPKEMAEKRDQQAKEISAYKKSEGAKAIQEALTYEKEYKVNGEKHTARVMKDGYSPQDLPQHRKYQSNKESGKNDVAQYNRNKDRSADEIEGMVGIDSYNMGYARVAFQKTRKELQELKLQEGQVQKRITTLKKLLGEEENNTPDYDPDIGPIDLTTWREGVETWNEKVYPKKYSKYLKELRKFMKDETKFAETGRDVTIKGAGLKIDKKPVGLDIVNHPNNKDEDVFIYEWTDYNENTKRMVGIRQKVLNNPSNSMYKPVQELIEKRNAEGYRPATREDFKKIIGVLPKGSEEEGLLGIEMFGGLFGWGVLEPIKHYKEGNVNARSFVKLIRSVNLRYFSELYDEDIYGSLFFVQDC